MNLMRLQRYPDFYCLLNFIISDKEIGFLVDFGSLFYPISFFVKISTNHLIKLFDHKNIIHRYCIKEKESNQVSIGSVVVVL